MRPGVSSPTSTPSGFFSQRFSRLYFFPLEHWVVWCVFLPSSSSWFICTKMWDHQPPPCSCSSPPCLPVSSPPTDPGECFFFTSLVVRLPYSSVFQQVWLFFVSKFVVLLLFVLGGKVYLPPLPSWPEVS